LVSIIAVALPSGQAAAAGSGVTAYVVDGGDALLPVNLTTDTAGSQITTGVSEPTAVAITPNGTTAYAADDGQNAVDPINTANNTAGTPITVDASPNDIAITPNGATAYVTAGSNAIDTVDLSNNTAGTPITLSGSATLDAIAISPDGKTAYVADTMNGTVIPIDLATKAAGTPISVGSASSFPLSIAITPNGATAYVVNAQDGSVVPIDLSTATAGTPITIGTNALYVAIAPSGATAYVTSNDVMSGASCCEETVTPIDTASNTAGTPIVVGALNALRGPGSIAVTPDGATVWVGTISRTMTPISTATNTVGAAIKPCLQQCQDFAITPDQGPIATLSVTPAVPGSPTSFNASASLAGSSPITDYAWSFGDGQTADTSTPTTTHSYLLGGDYTATVTLTDAAGTSTTQVFTGHTVSRNGGPRAMATAKVVIAANSVLVRCKVNRACKATITTKPTANEKGQTVSLGLGSGAGKGTVQVSEKQGTLACSKTTGASAPVTTVATKKLNKSSVMKLTDNVKGAKLLKGESLCYSSMVPFKSVSWPKKAKAGTALLLSCSKATGGSTDREQPQPCVKSVKQVCVMSTGAATKCTTSTPPVDMNVVVTASVPTTKASWDVVMP